LKTDKPNADLHKDGEESEKCINYQHFTVSAHLIINKMRLRRPWYSPFESLGYAEYCISIVVLCSWFVRD